MKDLEIKKIDHRKKEKDGREVDEYKATLKHETEDIKLVVKYDNEQDLDDLLGPVKIGHRVQVEISNNQTTIDDHEGE